MLPFGQRFKLGIGNDRETRDNLRLSRAQILVTPITFLRDNRTDYGRRSVKPLHWPW